MLAFLRQTLTDTCSHFNLQTPSKVKGSFRFEDEDEALCLRHNEIFKLFRLQLGRDDEVDLQQHCHAITVTDLSMRTMSKSWTWSSFSSSSSNLKLANDYRMEGTVTFLKDNVVALGIIVNDSK